MTQAKSRGFSPALLIIIVAAVIVALIIGWRVWEAGQNNKAQDQTQVTSRNDSPSPMPTKTFQSVIKPITFQYPQDWTIDIKSNEFESGFLYSPNGKKYAEFVTNLHNFGSSCDDTSYKIVRADAVNDIFTERTLYYVEEIRGKNANNAYAVRYSITDKDPSRETSPTSGCTAYSGYFDPNDGNGYVGFSGGTSITGEYFKTYEEALAFFSNPDYIKAKATLLSLRYQK